MQISEKSFESSAPPARLCSWCSRFECVLASILKNVS